VANALEGKGTERNALSSISPHFSATDFRSVCGSFPSGVTVVTRRLDDGQPYGMTVSSFTSVSLKPPLILVCIDVGAGFLQGISVGLPFAVNVLSEHQQSLAKRFSDRHENQRFSSVAWQVGWKRIPILNETSALFYCTVRDIVSAGDHAVLIADVHGLANSERRPLVWCERKYHCLPTSNA